MYMRKHVRVNIESMTIIKPYSHLDYKSYFVCKTSNLFTHTCLKLGFLQNLQIFKINVFNLQNTTEFEMKLDPDPINPKHNLSK